MGLFLQNIHVCLGGLFVPEAYITATRQYVAQANSWSLEELCLEVNVTASQSATLDACSFGVTGELSDWPFCETCFQMNVPQVSGQSGPPEPLSVLEARLHGSVWLQPRLSISSQV